MRLFQERLFHRIIISIVYKELIIYVIFRSLPEIILCQFYWTEDQIKRDLMEVLMPALKQVWGVMTIFNLPDKDELEIQMQKRIAELEKANQELRAEIFDRKQEKHRIKRYNNVLEGINRIFGSVVKAESEEQLAISCLPVAIDVTGSQIGFIGLVGDDRLLHDIAISDLGWEQCLMHKKNRTSKSSR